MYFRYLQVADEPKADGFTDTEKSLMTRYAKFFRLPKNSITGVTLLPGLLWPVVAVVATMKKKLKGEIHLNRQWKATRKYMNNHNLLR